jgi:hypothetical protein
MAFVLQKSSVLYEALLCAYPREFRQRFAAEMTETFAAQLSFETQQQGLRGFARVWNAAIRELFSVALPLQMRSSTALAMALSFVLSSVLFLAFFRAIPPACIK